MTLSKTKKKGREHKETIVNSIRDAVEKYNSVYVFNFENMRNLKFKEFRDQLRATSRYVHTYNSLLDSFQFSNVSFCLLVLINELGIEIRCVVIVIKFNFGYVGVGLFRKKKK